MGREDRERFNRDRGDRDRDRGGRDRSDRGHGDDYGGHQESQRIARDREKTSDYDMGGPKRMRHDQQMRPDVYRTPGVSDEYLQQYSKTYDQDQAPLLVILNQDGMHSSYSYVQPQQQFSADRVFNNQDPCRYNGGGYNVEQSSSKYARNIDEDDQCYPKYELEDRNPRSGRRVSSSRTERDNHLMNNSQQQRVLDRIRNINPQEIVAKKYEVKKFTANARLYIGNLSSDVSDGDLKELFQKHGEIDSDEIFLNKDKNFAFLKMDYRSSAEKARAELDGHMLKNRALKVRFAPACVRLKVKNLAPSISNELLGTAFSVFGDVERALVFVDEKGKSTGEGIVDFARKNFAMAADRFCKERCYFLSSELRPVETELGEMYEFDEGLMEGNLSNRGSQYGRGNQRQEQDFFQSREQGPRVAEDGSFEYDYGMEWKKLMKAYRQKELELKQEFEAEVDSLFKRMELARYDYETEMLRRQLRQRELDQERIRMEFEQRDQSRGRPSFFGGFDRGGPSMDDGRQMKMEFDRRPPAFVPQDRDRGQNPFGRGMEGQDIPPPADIPDDQDLKSDDLLSGMNPMAPPSGPPPQGLMDVDTAGGLGLDMSGINVGQPNISWETNTQFQVFQDQGQEEGTEKIYRDRPSRFSDSDDQGRQFFPRGGGGRGFRGGHGHHGGGGRMNRR